MTAPNNTSSRCRCSSSWHATPNVTDVEPLLTEASELVDTAISEIRRLAHGIYPPLLVSGGLAEALPALAARASVPVQLDLAAARPLPAFDRGRVLLLLQRSAAERRQTRRPRHHRHGHRRSPTNRRSRSTISDTGRGFDPTTMGMGLTNMTDRLSAIGGQLVIDTAPGRGTRIIAAVAAPAEPAN